MIDDKPQICGSILDEQVKGAAKEMYYLFIFSDDSIYEMENAVSFKDAIWEMAKYMGEASELLRKSLKGFENTDIDGIINLFNLFAYKTIDKVFLIDKKLYGSR